MNKKNDLNDNQTKCKALKLSNNDQWQYESFYRYQPVFSCKALLKFFTRRAKE